MGICCPVKGSIAESGGRVKRGGPLLEKNDWGVREMRNSRFGILYRAAGGLGICEFGRRIRIWDYFAVAVSG